MKRMNGGQQAAPGFYWNTAEWELVAVSKDEPRLPGDASRTYVRVPTLGVLAVAPVMGGLFAVFLPFIGFAMVIDQGGRRVLAMLRGTPVPAVVKQGSRRA